MRLNADEVHLWLAYYDEFANEQIGRYRTLLNEEETEQERRFFFERDRRRYLATRVLVRTVLSRYEQLGPKDWLFCTNAYGRPEIANVEIRASRLNFNISHTHSLIVLGVTRGRELGLDVENVLTREVSIEIAERFFSPDEARELASLPADQQQDRFFEYWTFKEAYIKARGMGLHIPLNKFSFWYKHSQAVEIRIDHELSDDAERWQFWQLRPTSDYVVAVCAEKIGSQSPYLVVRKAVSIEVDELLRLRCSRTSR